MKAKKAPQTPRCCVSVKSQIQGAVACGIRAQVVLRGAGGRRQDYPWPPKNVLVASRFSWLMEVLFCSCLSTAWSVGFAECFGLCWPRYMLFFLIFVGWQTMDGGSSLSSKGSSPPVSLVPQLQRRCPLWALRMLMKNSPKPGETWRLLLAFAVASPTDGENMLVFVIHGSALIYTDVSLFKEEILGYSDLRSAPGSRPELF